jgi:hypothetical protein
VPGVDRSRVLDPPFQANQPFPYNRPPHLTTGVPTLLVGTHAEKSVGKKIGADLFGLDFFCLLVSGFSVASLLRSFAFLVFCSRCAV